MHIVVNHIVRLTSIGSCDPSGSPPHVTDIGFCVKIELSSFLYHMCACFARLLKFTQPPYLYDLISIRPPHGHKSDLTVFITQSYSSLLIFGTSFLHRSEFLIRIIHPPLSDHHSNMPVYCNLLHTAITFHHFFTVSL